MENFYEEYIINNLKALDSAYLYCCQDFSHDALIAELYLDDEIKKQFCIIMLEKICKQEEAVALVANLTGKGGPIREACSFRINEFIRNPEFSGFFQSERFFDTYINSIVDINPTVSRNMVDSLVYIENKPVFVDKLFAKIFAILEELKDFVFSKSYILNKKTFALYWCLEALSEIVEDFHDDLRLEEILRVSSEFNDYTIREKIAKILAHQTSNSIVLKNVKEKLSIDENIYVRRHLSNVI